MAKTPAPNAFEHFDILDSIKPHTFAKPVTPDITEKTFFDPKHTSVRKHNPKLNQSILEKIRTHYNYKPLREDEIRLLLLQPGEMEDDIYCTIVVKPLERLRKKYTALSYHWGATGPDNANNRINIYPEPKQISEVVLQKTKKATPYHLWIHDNLFQAFLHLRLPDEPLAIWVDAICMNQEKTIEAEQEKKVQLRRMADIYNSADSVSIFLGVGDEQTDNAMRFIKEIVILDKFDGLVQDKSVRNKEDWLAFMELMKCRWFSRRWVVQEIALSRSAVVHCGNKSVHWNDFSDAVSLFMLKLDQIKQLFSNPHILSDVDGLGAVVLVDSISHLTRKSDEGDVKEHLVGLETLVSSLLSFAASTPHDIIYSLLALARDTPQKYATDHNAQLETAMMTDEQMPMDMDIDYKKNPIDVFIEFTEKCVRTSRSLDIICRHWAPDVPDKKFPSWIPKISDSTFGTPDIAVRGLRVNGDSFVGTAYKDARKNYNASRGTIADPNWVKFTSGPTPTLQAKGFKFATIEECSDPITGILNNYWIKKTSWDKKHSKNIVPDQLWRTLVADRGPDGGNPPGWYRRACLQCLLESNVTNFHGDMNVNVDVARLREIKPHSDVMFMFLQRVRSTVWNRRFLLAKSYCDACKRSGHDYLTCQRPTRTNTASSTESLVNGDETDHRKNSKKRKRAPSCADSNPQGTEYLFGLAPSRARNDDLVCILAGCTVPVVLRKCVNSSGSTFELIGEAYIYGKMDGEAMAYLDETTLTKKLRDITLQ